MVKDSGEHSDEPNAVRALLDLFVDMCLLRAKPQDLPASTSLLWLVLIVNIAAIFLAALAWLSAGAALLLALLSPFATALMLVALLVWRGGLNRFYQGLAAIFGTGAILQLVDWPLALWAARVGTESPDIVVPAMLDLILFIWSLVVLGHILRHTLNLRFVQGLAIATAFRVMLVYLQYLVTRTG